MGAYIRDVLLPFTNLEGYGDLFSLIKLGGTLETDGFNIALLCGAGDSDIKLKKVLGERQWRIITYRELSRENTQYIVIYTSSDPSARMEVGRSKKDGVAVREYHDWRGIFHDRNTNGSLDVFTGLGFDPDLEGYIQAGIYRSRTNGFRPPEQTTPELKRRFLEEHLPSLGSNSNLELICNADWAGMYTSKVLTNFFYYKVLVELAKYRQNGIVVFTYLPDSALIQSIHLFRSLKTGTYRLKQNRIDFNKKVVSIPFSFIDPHGIRELITFCELPFVVTGDHSLSESIESGGVFLYHPPFWKRKLTQRLAELLQQSCPSYAEVLLSHIQHDISLLSVPNLEKIQEKLSAAEIAERIGDRRFLEDARSAVSKLPAQIASSLGIGMRQPTPFVNDTISKIVCMMSQGASREEISNELLVR